MKFEIRSRWSGHILFAGQFDSLKLCVEAAVESRTNLSEAHLFGADGVNKHLSTPLRILLDQPGLIYAYKLVAPDMAGPYQGGIKYEMGKTYHVANANNDESDPCAAGINLATLDWCLKEWEEAYRILIAEFAAEDIAAIPTATDGKFRVRRCKIVGEKDLAELDWPPTKKEKGR